MKIYISADIEGVTGVTHWDEADRQNSDYKEFKEQMTAEVVAACEGALLVVDASQARLVAARADHVLPLHPARIRTGDGDGDGVRPALDLRGPDLRVLPRESD